MKAMVHAELLKLRTTRVFWANALVALAFVPISVATAMLTAGAQEGGAPALDTSEGIRNVIAAASSGSILVLVIGILIIAGEFRHNTATSVFLISPDRREVIAAKLAASVLVGVAIAVATAAITLAIALPWLSARDIHFSFFSDVGLVLLGAVAATAIYALVGVGVGSLIRNQTTAVVVALVWVMVVEAILVSFAPEVGRWLPGGAAATLSGAATASGDLLPMWAGALLFAAYGLAFAGIGVRFVMRRDIT